MKRFTELFSGSSVMLFHVALTGWMFCLAKINNDFQEMSLNYLPLCAALLLAYYLDRLMLHKGAPVPLFAVNRYASPSTAIAEPWKRKVS